MLQRTAAKDVNIPPREALLDTATGTVFEVISATDSNMTDRALTQHVLETFSDIQTPEDAIRKLKLIRRGVEPLVTYNNKYTAIHLVAYGIDPKLQMIELTWRTYANTLDKDLAGRLNKFITYQMDKDSNRREVHNLFDVMEKVKKLETQERKHKQYSDEKEKDDATQIKEEVHEVEYEEVNAINGTFQPKFNSTMNQRNNSFGSQSSGYHGSFNQNRYTPNSSSHSPNSRQNHSQNSSARPDQPHNTMGFSGSSAERQVDQVGTQRNPFNTSHHNSQDRSFNNRQLYNNQGRGFVNKYHHPRDHPRDRIRFEYGDSSKYGIIKNLRDIIAYLQNNGNKSFIRHRRYNGEINETDIHEMSIEDACMLIGEEVDKVYEALVIGDYIEEVSA